MEITKPFSKKRRVTQLVALVFLFLVLGPILVLFASGYSFQDILSTTKLKLQKTGGIYVAEIGTNSVVDIDSNDSQSSSFLDRTVLFQRLPITDHTIRIHKPGYREWSKKVSVYPNRVTEIRPVLLQEKIDFTRVTATTTRNEMKLLYSEKQKVSTTTRIVQDKRNIELFKQGTNLLVEWKSQSDAPYFLCFADQCLASTTIAMGEKILDVEWYPDRNDALIVMTAKDVSVVELDPRNDRKITSIITLDELKKESSLSSNLLPGLLPYGGLVYIHIGGNFYKIGL